MHGRSHGGGVRDNGVEVFDVDDNVHALLHMEVFEVLGMQRDGSLERLLENLCGSVSCALVGSNVPYHCHS